MKRKRNNRTLPGHIGLYPLLLAGCLSALADEVDVSKLPPPAKGTIDFTRDIKPILEENCLRCHGPEKPKSRFRLDNRVAALKGGDQGVDIVPGNSAKSALIHYVAYLVEDSEMPPVGKGKQLTADQVSSLRAWIDQGAVWETAENELLDFAFSPTIGGARVSGNKQKFSELNWQRPGLNGGTEKAEVVEKLDPDTRFRLSGHALRNDYEVNVALDRAGLGFIHSGWLQYRKYYDSTGGYDPVLSPSAPQSGQDLFLNIGKAWLDIGITIPDWPQVVLGYEYDYKKGGEATTEWNYSGTGATARNVGPSSRRVDEQVNILKADVTYDIQGVTLEDRFRGEFYRLSTGSTNVGFGPVPQVQSENEGTKYFQGANTFTMERKFADWLYASAGYLYSKLNADSTLDLELPTSLQSADLPRISLERESNVGNVNALLGPFSGLTMSAGALADWTRQSGFGPGLFDQQTIVPVGNIFTPFAVDSDYDQTTVEETAGLHYSKIPFTSLFAETRLEQQNIGQYDAFAASQNILNKAVFQQHTDFRSRSRDWRAGFDTSPWRYVTMTAHYRHVNDDSDYSSDPLVQPSKTAYPTFIRARDLNTDEVEARLILHPFSFLKTSLSYQYHNTRYDVTTGRYAPSPAIVISPGGELLSGLERANIFSISATVAPIARLYLTGSASYQNSTLTTASDGSLAVVPYRGDTYTVMANGTYVFSSNIDVFAGYLFSEANYGQSDLAQGLPLGMEYRRHSGQAGFSRRFGKNVTAKLQYRIDYYSEPGSGGANNFVAHSVWGTLAFTFR